MVTLAHPEAAAFDERQPYRILRLPTARGGRPVAILALNAGAIALAVRKRPDIVLSAHIIVGPAAALIGRRLGIPFVQYVHAKEIGTRPGLARFVLTRADRVITVSHYARELALTAGARPEQIALINPGVDAPLPTPENALRNPRPTLITVARLEDRYKGHDVVVRALPLVRAQVPDVTWHIVGDGPLRPALEDRVRALGLQEAVQFLGALSDEDRDRELASADVFCMVSRLPAAGSAGEGFGIVYLEANIHGLPVVAGAAGGAIDAVVDGETGLLVDPEDHVAVADALVSLLRDRESAQRMGRAGEKRARRLGWDAVGRRVEAELLQMLV